jgi:hypothetical protein
VLARNERGIQRKERKHCFERLAVFGKHLRVDATLVETDMARGGLDTQARQPFRPRDWKRSQ